MATDSIAFCLRCLPPLPCPKHQRRQSRRRKMTIPRRTPRCRHPIKSRWRNFPFFWSKEMMKLPLSMPVGRHSLKKWSRSFPLSAWKMRSCGNPPFRNKPRRNPDFLHTKSPPYVFSVVEGFFVFLIRVPFRPAVPFSEFLLQNPLLQRHLCRRYQNP